MDEWLINKEELPAEVWDLVKDLNPEDGLVDFLNLAWQRLSDFYGDKFDTASSLADSRFTPLAKMIERGMKSCGAVTHIFGTILRKFGVPVKYIHGQHKCDQGTDNRHSWLEVYDKNQDKWIGVDLTHDDFGMYSDVLTFKTYHDWQEFKADYDKGEC